MKKIKLNLTDLSVTSFETKKTSQKSGTVNGHNNDLTFDWGGCPSGAIHCKITGALPCTIEYQGCFSGNVNCTELVVCH